MKMLLVGAALLASTCASDCEGNVTVKPIVGAPTVEAQAATLTQVAQISQMGPTLYRYDDSTRSTTCWIVDGGRGVGISCLKVGGSYATSAR